MIQAIDSYLERYTRYWGGLYSLLAVLIITASLYTLMVSFWRGPFRDMWEALTFIEKAFYGQATLADYWEQYGFSHRPLVSRWLWMADYRWFAGSNHLLLGVSLLMQLAIALGVWRVVSAEKTFNNNQRIILMAGVFLCLFNISQVFNFLHTFDVQWFLTAAAVLWSVERLVTGMVSHRHHYLVCAWLSVLVASWNNFSGLVIWPVHLVFMHAMGYHRTQRLLYFAATALYFAMYFHGLPTGTGQLLQNLAKEGGAALLVQFAIMTVAVFPAWYLSNPFSFQFAPEGPLGVSWPLTWMAPVIAGLVILWVLLRSLRVILKKEQLSAAGWMGLLLSLYGYAVAVVTSLGRGIFWDNVYALRYQNIVLLFWVGILLLLASTLRFRSAALFVGCVLLMVFVGVHQTWYHNHMIKMGNRTRDAHLALVVGLESQLSAIQATVSRSHLFAGTTYNLEKEAAFLRKIQAGPFADPQWNVPDFTVLEHVATCADPVASVDVRGHENAYARLSLDFVHPVDYPLVAWFDADKSKPGLLIATRADTFHDRLLESLAGFRHYAGFARNIPVLAPDALYARSSMGWCRLVIPSVDR